MRISRILLGLAATGGVAAALFGGGVVQTSFTSSASGTIKASTASTGTKLAGGTINLANAIPGDSTSASVTVTNKGTTPELLSVSFGSGSNPTLDSYIDITWGGDDAGTLADLGGEQNSLNDGTPLAPGASVTIPVKITLDSSAGNDVAGMSDSVSYTITGTATSDTGTPGAPLPGGWNISKNQST